jgi:hypothetical protein
MLWLEWLVPKCRYQNKNLYIKLMTTTLIDGDKTNYPTILEFVRYHLIIPNVAREPLLMQDSVCCDYNRHR